MHRYKIFTESDDGDYLMADGWGLDYSGSAIFMKNGDEVAKYPKDTWFYIQEEK